METGMMDCEHQDDLRVRTFTNGTRHFVRQCGVCGRSSIAISQKTLTAVEMRDAPPFDETLQDRWWDAGRAERERLRHHEQEEKSAAYAEYLRSPEWRVLRGLVISRARRCEGCGVEPPYEVHHLTYAHIGHEFLFELVALCSACHRRVHEVDDEPS
jgi:hypothetical protein